MARSDFVAGKAHRSLNLAVGINSCICVCMGLGAGCESEILLDSANASEWEASSCI